MKKAIQVRELENLEMTLKYAAEAGFNDVSIGFDSSKASMFIGDDYKKKLNNICELLNKYNLNCVQTHLPAPYHLLVSSETVDEISENMIKRGIEATAVLGAEWTAYHPRTAISDGYNREKSYEHNKNFLFQYLEYAEKAGVGIAVENMPLYPYTIPEWRFFGGGYEELCVLCDDIGSDNIGICWDFGHAHTAAINQNSALEYIGDKLKITHIHDNYRNGDHHLLPLLGGDVDIWRSIKWSEVMPSLKKINYNGPLTLEINYPPISILKSFVNMSYDCISSIEELVQK